MIQISELRDILNRVPDIALVIFGSSAWNGFHTFFLPTNNAFAKVNRLNCLSSLPIYFINQRFFKILD